MGKILKTENISNYRCQLCEKECRDIKHLAIHIRHSHKEIDGKFYYDSFMKIDGEDICINPNCNKSVSFTTLGKGYKTKQNKTKYCSLSCARLSEAVQEKQRLTSMGKYGDLNYRNPEKNKQTCIEKYGVENVLCKGTSFSKKRDNSVLKKYGVENVFQCEKVKDKIKIAMIERGEWIDYNDPRYNDYREYYRVAWNYYKSIKEEYLENWDGYDYYDMEYIKDNLNMDPNSPDFPSIDHKISIKKSYLLKISPLDVSKFDNLCVTKRRLNSLKKTKNVYDFIVLLKNKKDQI